LSRPRVDRWRQSPGGIRQDARMPGCQDARMPGCRRRRRRADRVPLWACIVSMVTVVSGVYWVAGTPFSSVSCQGTPGIPASFSNRGKSPGMSPHRQSRRPDRSLRSRRRRPRRAAGGREEAASADRRATSHGGADHRKETLSATRARRVCANPEFAQAGPLSSRRVPRPPSMRQNSCGARRPSYFRTRMRATDTPT
jgi:hypothetical protein